MTRRLIRVVLLMLFCLPLMGQDYNAPFNPQPAAGGGFDFTGDANAIGCWGITDTDSETGAETDQCGANAMVYTGTWSKKAAQPGSSGQIASSQDGSTESYKIDPEPAGFEAADFTVGMWVTIDDAATVDTFFNKGQTENWSLERDANDKLVGIVTNVSEVSEGALPQEPDTWSFVTMTYDGTGTDTITVYINGTADCSISCSTSADPTGNTDELTIAGDEFQTGGALHDGGAMDVFYMDRVMTATEIKEVVLCGFDGTADFATRESTYGDAACAGSGDPWTCCTGSGTGTCIDCDDISTCC